MLAELPGVAEGSSYGTPAFKVRGKLFARLHQDGESLVVRVDPEQRELLLRAGDEAFFITDHYRDHPWMQVRLAVVDHGQLQALLHYAWRLRAPPALLKQHDSG